MSPAKTRTGPHQSGAPAEGPDVVSVSTWLVLCATVSALADLAALIVLVGPLLLGVVQRGGGGWHRR